MRRLIDRVWPLRDWQAVINSTSQFLFGRSGQQADVFPSVFSEALTLWRGLLLWRPLGSPKGAVLTYLAGNVLAPRCPLTERGPCCQLCASPTPFSVREAVALARVGFPQLFGPPIAFAQQKALLSVKKIIIPRLREHVHDSRGDVCYKRPLVSKAEAIFLRLWDSYELRSFS